MNALCVNCGLVGHYIQKCKYPITSYGIILYDPQNKKYLMICRSKSFGYIEFLTGNYCMDNKLQIQFLIDEMSVEEKEKLVTHDFTFLWNDLWFKKQMDEKGRKKFGMLKRELVSMVNSSPTNWKTPEWEFPKGRKKMHEKMADCAVREFIEETGYTHQDIKLVENVLPFEEVFIGSNVKVYKHKYFLAVLTGDVCPPNAFQYSEIGKLKWLTYEECLEHIRDYNIEKKQMLLKVNNLVSKYNILL